MIVSQIILGLATVLLLLTPAAHAVVEPDSLLEGKATFVKQGGFFLFSAEGPLALPATDNDPRTAGATLRVLDTGGTAGDDVYPLPADGWERVPRNERKSARSYIYHGAGTPDDPCKLVILRRNGLSALCMGDGVSLDPPFAGEVGIVLSIAGDMKRYCASFGGREIKNNSRQTMRKDAPPPAACPVPGGTTSTTIGGGSTTTSTTVDTPTTTSTTVGTPTTTSTTVDTPTTTSTTVDTPTTTSTTVDTPTTTSTTVATPTTSTSSTSTSSTSSTTAATPTTSTSSTSTSSTSSTTVPGCCNGQDFLSFSTLDQPGDCGNIVSVTGTSIDLACSGLYTGGGGNSVPLPYAIPDQGVSVTEITQCTGQTATLAGTTSAQTGDPRTCSSTGCLFGAPLAIPNPSSTPTSVCVINRITGSLSGTADCSTGATNAMLPLGPIIFLTGDTLPDPGIQPCPLCTGTCAGGPNNGMACDPGTSDLGDEYPTSQDCPPDPMTDIGTLPINFSLTTGTVTWQGTTATNDTGTEANQSRVFSGFCRDADITTNFGNPAQLCWENGMAVGGPCAGTFETCEQRSNGAFGPGGGGTMTITAIGSASGLLSGPAPGTLVSIFSIPPTFNATVDAAGDLPGPGAVAIPGTAELCATAASCP